jgi:hypothetical protein
MSWSSMTMKGSGPAWGGVCVCVCVCVHAYAAYACERAWGRAMQPDGHMDAAVPALSLAHQISSACPTTGRPPAIT